MSKKIAAIRIRGRTGVKHDIEDAMESLNLDRIHSCIIIEETARVIGQLKKCNDFVTWGYIDNDTLTKLQEKGDVKTYHLHPPRGGHARKGIKVNFSRGGALGFRDDKINDLINKML